MARKGTEAIQIEEIGRERITIPIRGTAPLLSHRFSEKAKQQMLGSMTGKKVVKQPKNPEAEYLASHYYMKDGSYGFPALAFKMATVGGARYFGGLTMTALKQFIFSHGEMGEDGKQLVRIIGESRMNEDVARINHGQGTDLRYRAEFPEWSATLEFTYVTSALTRDSLISLIDAGGFGVGVGDWRPEKDGDHGTYEIDPTREIEVIER